MFFWWSGDPFSVVFVFLNTLIFVCVFDEEFSYLYAFFWDFRPLLGPCFCEFSRFSGTSFRMSFVIDFSFEFYQFFNDCLTWLCNDFMFLYSLTWYLCKHDFWRTLQRFCLIFTYSVCVEIWEKLQNTFVKTSTKCAAILLYFGYENQWTHVRKNTKNRKIIIQL